MCLRCAFDLDVINLDVARPLRYGREPYDIYCPASVCRVNADGAIENPSRLELLTIDGELGRLVPELAREVTPHLIRAFVRQAEHSYVRVKEQKTPTVKHRCFAISGLKDAHVTIYPYPEALADGSLEIFRTGVYDTGKPTPEAARAARAARGSVRSGPREKSGRPARRIGFYHRDVVTLLQRDQSPERNLAKEGLAE